MAAAGFLTVAAAVTFFALPDTRIPSQHLAHRPTHIAHAAPIARSTPKIVHAAIAVPPPESDFAREARMSHIQLMSRWSPLVAIAAKRFAVPPAWIRAVMQLESGGRTMLGVTQPMLSSAGAMGLMQLMPATYEDMRAEYRLGSNPYDPHDNIFAGAAYLHWLYGKYGYPAMFAAYNDGPGNLEQRLLDGNLLPVETINYVGNITARLEGGGAGGPRNQAKFTRPNGEPVVIDIAAVASVRAAFPGEYAPGVQSVISVGTLRQGVRESVATVTAAIRAHGGIAGPNRSFGRLFLTRARPPSQPGLAPNAQRL